MSNAKKKELFPTLGVPVAPTFRPAPGRISSGEKLTSADLTVNPLVRSYYQRKPAQLPNLKLWVAAISRATVEVLNGSRPCAQLSRWFTPLLYEAVARRHALAKRLGTPTEHYCARVLSLHIQPAIADRIQACATIDDGTKIRCVALQLCAHRNKWQITSLEVG